jgi:hypothetical protein
VADTLPSIQVFLRRTVIVAPFVAAVVIVSLMIGGAWFQLRLATTSVLASRPVFFDSFLTWNVAALAAATALVVLSSKARWMLAAGLGSASLALGMIGLQWSGYILNPLLRVVPGHMARFNDAPPWWADALLVLLVAGSALAHPRPSATLLLAAIESLVRRWIHSLRVLPDRLIREGFVKVETYFRSEGPARSPRESTKPGGGCSFGWLPMAA